MSGSIIQFHTLNVSHNARDEQKYAVKQSDLLNTSESRDKKHLST